MKILLIGALGKMGTKMQEYLKTQNCDFFALDKMNISQFKTCNADIILDFSSSNALEQNLKIAKHKKIPIIIGTTNHSQYNYKLIDEYKTYISIFMTSNFSLGFNVMLEMIKHLKKLNDYQFVIMEKHHKHKKDSPSGSAKTIEKCLNENNISSNTIALRVGEIVGEHSLQVYGDNEYLEIKHVAQSKMLFCEGAYKVCKFMLNKKNGLYTMEDMLKSDCL